MGNSWLTQKKRLKAGGGGKVGGRGAFQVSAKRESRGKLNNSPIHKLETRKDGS